MADSDFGFDVSSPSSDDDETTRNENNNLARVDGGDAQAENVLLKDVNNNNNNTMFLHLNDDDDDDDSSNDDDYNSLLADNESEKNDSEGDVSLGEICWDEVSDGGDKESENEEDEDDADGEEFSENDEDDNSNGGGQEQRALSSPTKKRRRRFTVRQKLYYLRHVKSKIAEENMSVKKACKEINVHPRQFYAWRNQEDCLKAVSNRHVKSLAPGRPSLLDNMKDELLAFIFERREQGIGVTIKMVAAKACTINRRFREKTRLARYQSIRRFVRKHAFVYRMSTHESQRTPAETSAEALDWMEMIRPRLAQPNRHHDYIINMDQTPIPFTYNRDRTLEVIGRRTVHVRKSTNDTKRATFAMTVTASGFVLKPFLIFKGTATGRIVQRELPMYSIDMVYACQSNAWMDERLMIEWVEKILKPYCSNAPEGIVPILFLDSYRCHMMSSVVNMIQDCGIEVEHIPGGCTGLCQPVDVGINKPFKNRIREQWEEWMIEVGLATGTTKPPERKDIVKWVLHAKNNLPDYLVRNAWRHGAYTWFPPTCAEQATRSDDESNGTNSSSSQRDTGNVAQAVNHENNSNSDNN